MKKLWQASDILQSVDGTSEGSVYTVIGIGVGLLGNLNVAAKRLSFSLSIRVEPQSQFELDKKESLTILKKSLDNSYFLQYGFLQIKGSYASAHLKSIGVEQTRMMLIGFMGDLVLNKSGKSGLQLRLSLKNVGKL